MNRRQFLRVGALGTVTLGGCLVTAPSGQQETTTPTGPVRGEGEPVSETREVIDEPGYEDGMEYFPDNETVRFVAARSGGEPVEFDTWTVQEWARIETAEVGAERVADVTAERVGTEELSTGIGQPPDTADVEGPVITLQIEEVRDRDGEVISTPALEFSTLVAATPRSADVTLSLEGDSHRRTVPVFGALVTLSLD